MTSFAEYPDDYFFLPHLTYYGNFPSATGWKSAVLHSKGYNTLFFGMKATNNVTISISANSSPTHTGGILVYQETLTAGTNFSKKIPIQYLHYHIEITTTDLTDEPFECTGGLSLQMLYDTKTYLNSIIPKHENTQLIRVGNDFHTDIVRGMHAQFSKVNIQGIFDSSLQSVPISQTITLGNSQNITTNMLLFTGGIPFYINSASPDDYTTGIGAQTLRMKYIDEDGDIASVDIYAGTGIIGISGRSVISLVVLTTGTSSHNVGNITITSINTAEVYCQMFPQENISHTAIYQVPSSSQLIVRELNLTGELHNATLLVKIADTNGIIGTFGRFILSTQQSSIRYDLDVKLTAGQVILLDLVSTNTVAPSVPSLVNVNLNAILCPVVNNF
jgi:hypothetical protein